jgi:MerR family Zn(II)-responsive transcriptional regulator of zntA
MPDAEPATQPALIKVGELARLAGVLPSTIRYYISLGLVEPDSRSPGGYALFDPSRVLPRLRRIQELQSERFRLDEIASILVGEGGVRAG